MSALPYISCMCPTYGRTELLEEAVESFLRQDYKGRKQLVILNDFTSQELEFSHPEIKILNLSERLGSLGEVRNACVEACDGEIIAYWDDDDVHLPSFLSLVAREMTQDWLRMSRNLYSERWEIKKCSEGAANNFAFSKAAWKRIGGYNKINSGEDKDLYWRMKAKCPGRIYDVKPSELCFIYGWGNGHPHISSGGRDRPGYSAHERIGAEAAKKATAGKIPVGTITLNPHWKVDWQKKAEDFINRMTPVAVVNQSFTTDVTTTGLLSVVITALNDQAELTNTINSIRQTAGNIPIIVVDDCSHEPVQICTGVKLWRNQVRLGVGPSRHIGVELTQTRFVLIIDSHMRFEQGWYAKAIANLEAQPEVIWCGTCLGLGDGHPEIVAETFQCAAAHMAPGHVAKWKNHNVVRMQDMPHRHMVSFKETQGDVVYQMPVNEQVTVFASPVYRGATLNLYGPSSDRNPQSPKQVFEGKWKQQEQHNGIIPCLMGASYFMARDVFFKIGGTNEFRMWGTSEPYLSVRAWLAGYEIRMMTEVRIGHRFRHAIPGTNPPQYHIPYNTDGWTNVYNKIRMALTIGNEAEQKFFMERLAEIYGASYKQAMVKIEADMPSILERRDYYAKIFQHDLKWYADKFHIPYPL